MADLERGRGLEASGRSHLAIREVVGESVATFARAPWTLMWISLLPSLAGLIPDAARRAAGPHTGLAALIAAIGVFAQVFVAVLVQGAVTAGVSRLIAGDRFGVGSAFRVGLRRGAPLFLLGLLAVLIVVLGMICLVVPGLIAAFGLSVAAPACVIEECSPVASLKRSWELTRGHRWRIFGLGAALIVLVSALVALGVVVAAAVASGLAALHVAKAIAVLLAVLAIVPVFAVLTGFASVVPVVLFHRLGGGLVAGPWSASSVKAAAPGIPA